MNNYLTKISRNTFMKRDNSPEQEQFKRVIDLNSSESGAQSYTNRSLLGKQSDKSFIDTQSQKRIKNCENDILSNKIKSMLKTLVIDNKKKSNSSITHGKLLIEQKRNAVNSTTRESSQTNSTQQLPLSCFSYHFPKSPHIPPLLNLSQQQLSQPENSARLTSRTNQNELYYPLNKKSSIDRDRAISQYISQRKHLSQPKNDAVKPNYLQYLQEIKKNFETIGKHDIYSPKQQLTGSSSNQSNNYPINISQKQITPVPSPRHMSSEKMLTPRNISAEKTLSQRHNLNDKSIPLNHQQSTVSTSVSEDYQIYSNLSSLCLQKEEVLYEMQRKSEEKVLRTSFNLLLEKYQKIVVDLTRPSNEKLLQKIDKNISQSLFLDLLGIFIFSTELKKIPLHGCQLDINQKNLIQYLCQNSLFVIDKLLTNSLPKNNAEMHGKMQARVNERSKNTGRRSAQNKCSLQKNNDIVNSISLMMQLIIQIETNQFSLDSIEDSDCPDMFAKVLSNSTVDFSSRVNVILSAIRMEVIKKLYYLKNPQICLKNDSQLTFVSVALSEPDKVNSMPPYLNKLSGKQYSLVLDLDETLVHYQEFEEGGGQFLVRPHAETFLIEMSKYYELIIFTASLPDYANFILDIIDKKKCISYRLYRQHTQLKGNIHLKDLSKLGRSITKIIIVDNLPENFQLQPDNGIFIQSWIGDSSDRALKDLSHLLIGIDIKNIEIVKKKCKDVRYGLKVLRDQMLQRIQNGCKDPYSNLTLGV